MILFVFTMTFCFSPLLFPVPGLRKEGKSEAKGRSKNLSISMTAIWYKSE